MCTTLNIAIAAINFFFSLWSQVKNSSTYTDWTHKISAQMFAAENSIYRDLFTFKSSY